jgi:hypothetical protein
MWTFQKSYAFKLLKFPKQKEIDEASVEQKCIQFAGEQAQPWLNTQYCCVLSQQNLSTLFYRKA